MSGQYFVYILTNRPRGVLYTGVTGNLGERIASHKDGGGSWFTQKYKTHTLVYFETFGEVSDAIAHEKRLKRWKRDWKVELIEKSNPEWRELMP